MKKKSFPDSSLSFFLLRGNLLMLFQRWSLHFIYLHQGFSASVLLMFWARYFFIGCGLQDVSWNLWLLHNRCQWHLPTPGLWQPVILRWGPLTQTMLVIFVCVSLFLLRRQCCIPAVVTVCFSPLVIKLEALSLSLQKDLPHSLSWLHIIAYSIEQVWFI